MTRPIKRSVLHFRWLVVRSGKLAPTYPAPAVGSTEDVQPCFPRLGSCCPSADICDGEAFPPGLGSGDQPASEGQSHKQRPCCRTRCRRCGDQTSVRRSSHWQFCHAARASGFRLPLNCRSIQALGHPHGIRHGDNPYHFLRRGSPRHVPDILTAGSGRRSARTQASALHALPSQRKSVCPDRIIAFFHPPPARRPQMRAICFLLPLAEGG